MMKMAEVADDGPVASNKVSVGHWESVGLVRTCLEATDLNEAALHFVIFDYRRGYSAASLVVQSEVEIIGGKRGLTSLCPCCAMLGG